SMRKPPSRWETGQTGEPEQLVAPGWIVRLVMAGRGVARGVQPRDAVRLPVRRVAAAVHRDDRGRDPLLQPFEPETALLLLFAGFHYEDLLNSEKQGSSISLPVPRGPANGYLQHGRAEVEAARCPAQALNES